MRITVLIATRNRAAVLRETLDAMSRLLTDSVVADLLVIDNGSVDETPQVLATYNGGLPLQQLQAPTAGKSRALNCALERADLGDIVAFTDDDITPHPCWLEEIAASALRWPSHALFGGRIDPQWPDGRLSPAWASHDSIQTLAFARHQIAESESEYPPDKDPFGGNYWVRRAAIGNARFLENIGAHPERPILGDETQFVRQLRRRGHVPMYVPAARVRHRLDRARLTKRAVYSRAVQGGRSFVYTRGLPDQELLERSPLAWGLRRARAIARNVVGLPFTMPYFDEGGRVLTIVEWLWNISQNLEALRVAAQRDPDLLQVIGYCPAEEWLG